MLITEATLNCLAVIASLCVPDTAKADISSGPGWVGAVIATKNTRITSTIASDALIYPYKKLMQDLCSGESCILYKGFCGKNVRKFSCNIWYSVDENSELRRIEVIGKQDSVLSVLSRVKLVISSDVMIPLSTFHYNAKDASPPTCYARQGCTAD